MDRQYDLLADPLRESRGQIVGVICAAIDITERKQTEDALRSSESQFRRLFESGLIGIGFPDRFGGFSAGNDELLRTTGYSREDLRQGRVRWDRMTPPEYRELDALHITEAAERGSCTPYEKEYIGDRSRPMGDRGHCEEAQRNDCFPKPHGNRKTRNDFLRFPASYESIVMIRILGTPAGLVHFRSRRRRA